MKDLLKYKLLYHNRNKIISWFIFISRIIIQLKYENLVLKKYKSQFRSKNNKTNAKQPI